MATSKTINGDCLEELKKLDDNSIDLLCTADTKNNTIHSR